MIVFRRGESPEGPTLEVRSKTAWWMAMAWGVPFSNALCTCAWLPNVSWDHGVARWVAALVLVTFVLVWPVCAWRKGTRSTWGDGYTWYRVSPTTMELVDDGRRKHELRDLAARALSFDLSDPEVGRLTYVDGVGERRRIDLANAGDYQVHLFLSEIGVATSLIPTWNFRCLCAQCVAAREKLAE